LKNPESNQQILKNQNIQILNQPKNPNPEQPKESNVILKNQV
jgi:hypothetical protein